MMNLTGFGSGYGLINISQHLPRGTEMDHEKLVKTAGI